MPITYGELAEELHLRYGLEPKARKTLYGRPVGVVGYVLQDLEKRWKSSVPPINVLVVRKSTGLPGTGADEIVRYFFRGAKASKFSEDDRAEMMQSATEAVFDYGENWVKVARALGVDLLDVASGPLDDGGALDIPSPPFGGGGESREHQALKKWVAGHPELFADYGKYKPGVTEWRLSSGDQADVFFNNRRRPLAVEVKTSSAAVGELVRGVFQVVKYRAVLRAEQQVRHQVPNAAAVLVTPQKPDLNTRKIMARLKVDWITVPLRAERS
ncbi:hypothetical protein [Lysobacter enzymogenes]|uniref:hypothetical protein n=1 Tax=Lysobacter enzymogenes TaxID=69 RepID=UPI001A970CC3|nr:hypothetical protein [Lysobacter enzymogenes]QQP96731.1 hypothetical protein JHW38_01360 [Lysobacter enzymogenes]